MNKGMYSSETGEWGTPQYLFDELDSEFRFTLDPRATNRNAKCQRFFTKEDDGLGLSWAHHNVFMNPPYGREIGKWVEKAYLECWAEVGFREHETEVVGLLPARTDTAWFHDYIYKSAREIRFLRGRLKFEGNGEGTNSAPFPSMVVIF